MKQNCFEGALSLMGGLWLCWSLMDVCDRACVSFGKHTFQDKKKIGPQGRMKIGF